MTDAARPPFAFNTRLARAGDEPFVFRSWLKACRRCLRHRALPSEVYYQDHHANVERLLGSTFVSLRMAIATDDDDRLYGFLCTETIGGSPKILHFAYVKDDVRRRGIFRGLAAAAGLDLARPFFYTAHPTVANSMATAFPLAKYNAKILEISR